MHRSRRCDRDNHAVGISQSRSTRVAEIVGDDRQGIRACEADAAKVLNAAIVGERGVDSLIDALIVTVAVPLPLT